MTPVGSWKIAMSAGREAVAQHRPEPRTLLLPALGVELARRRERRAVLHDAPPDAVDAAMLERADREHGRLPVGALVTQQAERVPVLRSRPLGALDVVA